MVEKQKPPAGWYSDPDAADINRYWDGDAWTSQRKPQAAQTAAGTNPWMIALGILIAAAVIWFVYGIVTADDDLDCATRNAENSLSGLPQEDCG